MPDIVPLEPLDYLVVGHVARDLTPQGPQLGGTVAYAALTARAAPVAASLSALMPIMAPPARIIARVVGLSMEPPSC